MLVEHDVEFVLTNGKKIVIPTSQYNSIISAVNAYKQADIV